MAARSLTTAHPLVPVLSAPVPVQRSAVNRETAPSTQVRAAPQPSPDGAGRRGWPWFARRRRRNAAVQPRQAAAGGRRFHMSGRHVQRGRLPLQLRSVTRLRRNANRPARSRRSPSAPSNRQRSPHGRSCRRCRCATATAARRPQRNPARAGKHSRTAARRPQPKPPAAHCRCSARPYQRLPNWQGPRRAASQVSGLPAACRAPSLHPACRPRHRSLGAVNSTPATFLLVGRSVPSSSRHLATERAPNRCRCCNGCRAAAPRPARSPAAGELAGCRNTGKRPRHRQRHPRHPGPCSGHRSRHPLPPEAGHRTAAHWFGSQPGSR